MLMLSTLQCITKFVSLLFVFLSPACLLACLVFYSSSVRRFAPVSNLEDVIQHSIARPPSLVVNTRRKKNKRRRERRPSASDDVKSQEPVEKINLKAMRKTDKKQFSVSIHLPLKERKKKRKKFSRRSGSSCEWRKTWLLKPFD
jgi:hypothetical protein